MTGLLLCYSISEMYSGFCMHWKKKDSHVLHDVLLQTAAERTRRRSSDT